MTPLWSWLLVLAAVAVFVGVCWLIIDFIDDMLEEWRR